MKDTKNTSKTFIFMDSLNRTVGSEEQDCEFEEGNNESNWSGGTPQLVRRFACCTLHYLGHPIIPFFTLLMSVGSSVPMSSSIDSRPM